MNAVRMMSLALILTAGLLAAACGGQSSSASVADNPAAVSPSEPTRQSAATSTSAPADTPAPSVTSAPAPTDAIRVATPTRALTQSPDDTVSSADPTMPPEPTPIISEGMVKVPAPIESVDIAVAESHPPQYFAHIVSGLPNGCVEFYGYEETRSGDTINITVTNLEPGPSSPAMACAAIYLTQETSVALGKDFESGKEYTVKVNEFVESFVAQ